MAWGKGAKSSACLCRTSRSLVRETSYDETTPAPIDCHAPTQASLMPVTFLHWRGARVPVVPIVLLTGLLLAVLSGCTHTQTFDVAVPTEREQVNAQFENRTTRITFVSGDTLYARSVSVAPDTTTWVEVQGGEAGAAPTSEVLSIRYKDGRQGVLEGLGLGFALGGGLGLIVGSDGQENSEEWLSGIGPSRGQVALGMGALGGLLGAAIGLARRSRIVYRIQPTPTSTPEGLSESAHERP